MARIIIVDDDELVLALAAAALEARGHIVGALPNGERVRTVVAFKRPDVVILDCAMPRVSGLQALREIRASEVAYRTPVLVLTGRQGVTDEGIAWESGADDYMRKPFDPDELVARVEALIPSPSRSLQV